MQNYKNFYFTVIRISEKIIICALFFFGGRRESFVQREQFFIGKHFVGYVFPAVKRGVSGVRERHFLRFFGR